VDNEMDPGDLLLLRYEIPRYASHPPRGQRERNEIQMNAESVKEVGASNGVRLKVDLAKNEKAGAEGHTWSAQERRLGERTWQSQ
jgi:hypothetical protein